MAVVVAEHTHGRPRLEIGEPCAVDLASLDAGEPSMEPLNLSAFGRRALDLRNMNEEESPIMNEKNRRQHSTASSPLSIAADRLIGPAGFPVDEEAEVRLEEVRLGDRSQPGGHASLAQL